MRQRGQTDVARSRLNMSACLAKALQAALISLLVGCGETSGTDSYPVSWTLGLALAGISETSSIPVSQADLGTLLSAPWPSPIELEDYRNDGDATSVNSCHALFRSISVNPYLQPAKPFETPFYLHRANICLALKALAEAKPSRSSFSRSFKLDESAPDLLPAELAFAISREDEDLLSKYRGQILASVFKNEKRFNMGKTEVLSPYSVQFSDSQGGRQEMTILGYGDFNRDGIEDILLLVRNDIASASYRAFMLYQLTRPDSGPFKLLHEYVVLRADEKDA